MINGFLCIKFAAHTDEIEQALSKPPNFCHGTPQLQNACEHNVRLRTQTRSSLLPDEPRQTQQQPHTRRESDQDAQAPRILRVSGVHLQSEHNTHDDCQDKDLTTTLNVERDVTKSATHNTFVEVILL